MTVGAYRDRSIQVARSKSGRSRTVYLNAEGCAFFEQLVAGRPLTDRMFLHPNGSAWGKSHQIRPMKLASAAAEIDPPISFHILRHTYASLYLMSHGDLAGLSKQLGHADTRMTIRHYGHLADRWRREEAERHAPSLGIDPSAVISVGGQVPSGAPA
jgi:integrase